MELGERPALILLRTWDENAPLSLSYSAVHVLAERLRLSTALTGHRGLALRTFPFNVPGQSPPLSEASSSEASRFPAGTPLPFPIHIRVERLVQRSRFPAGSAPLASLARPGVTIVQGILAMTWTEIHPVQRQVSSCAGQIPSHSPLGAGRQRESPPGTPSGSSRYSLAPALLSLVLSLCSAAILA